MSIFKFSVGDFCYLPVTLLGLVLLTPVSAGMRSQTLELVRVDLGEDLTIPGLVVTVPCFLRAGADVGVGKIEMEITFPHEKVSFEHVRRGLLSDQIQAEITSEVQASPKDPELSIIKLSLTPGETIPIPPGFLFDLVFRISPELAMDSPPILLQNQSRAYRFSESPELLANVESQDGLIRVASEPPPVAACFFFMH